MCVVSSLGDFAADRWRPYIQPPNVYPGTATGLTINTGISRAEFDALKAEVVEMRELLRAAKRIDELTGQPECETEAKLAVLRQVAEMVGLSLDDVLGGASS